MAEGASRRRRVFIPDSRANGLYLRATWHPDGRQFVVSTWHDDVCTGAVRVPLESSADLLALLADGLADAATTPLVAPGPPAPSRSWWQRLRGMLAGVRRPVASAPAHPEAESATIPFRESA